MNSRTPADWSIITVDGARHAAECARRRWVQVRCDEKRSMMSFRPSGNPSEVLRVIVLNESKMLCVLVHITETGENVPLYHTDADLTTVSRLMENSLAYKHLRFRKEEDVPNFAQKDEGNDRKASKEQGKASSSECRFRELLLFASEELESIRKDTGRISEHSREMSPIEVHHLVGASSSVPEVTYQSTCTPRSDGELPPEVLVQVLRHADVASIRNARLVCCEWRRTVDDNSSVLWEARCRALDLLPDTLETFLGRQAKFVEIWASVARRSSKQKGVRWANDLVADIYRQHYRTFIRQICSSCEPSNAAEVKANMCCTHPSNFKWLDRHHWVQMNKRIANVMSVTHHPFVPQPCSDVAYRVKDVLRYLNLTVIHSKDLPSLVAFVSRHMGD